MGYVILLPTVCVNISNCCCMVDKSTKQIFYSGVLDDVPYMA